MTRAPRHNKINRWGEDETPRTTPAFDPLLALVLVGLDELLVLVRCKELETDEVIPSTVYTRT
jgi:hypothetical protein